MQTGRCSAFKAAGSGDLSEKSNTDTTSSATLRFTHPRVDQESYMLRSICAAGLISGLCLTPLSAPALAQDTETLVFEGQTWEVSHAQAGEIHIGQFMDRDALYIRRGQAQLLDVDLADMVIDYSYAPTHQSGFMGVNWRIVDGSNAEQFYTRPHQSGQPDATQYQPVINGSTAWQIYAGPNDAAAVDIEAAVWSHIRIVAIGDQAEIYIDDMETPRLHIPDLRIDNAHGGLALFMSDRPWMPETGAWFSNVSIRATTDEDRLVGTPNEEPELPNGLITQWDVSDTFVETELDAGFDLSVDASSWTALPVENNGVANLARTSRRDNGNNTVLARVQVTAMEDTVRLMRFGYSDRIRLYLNGQQVYAGNAGWRARDHRHLGTIGFNDSVPLQLREGPNEIVAAISESFGGWGVAAAIEEQDGLQIAR
jgi:hypothetical protein